MIEGSGNETARTESARTEDYREVAGCACFHVRRAARLVTQDFDDALSAVGLKATQYTVLCALAGPWKRPPSLVVLADYLLVEPSALSRNVAVLVKRGLLVLELRIPSEARWSFQSDAGSRSITTRVGAERRTWSGFGFGFLFVHLRESLAHRAAA